VTRRLGDGVPPKHLARCVVDTSAHLDLAALSARYGARGGQPSAPAIWCGLRFSGDAPGVCRARQLARATCASVPCRLLAGTLPPAHDTVAALRPTFLPALQDLCVQGLLLTQGAGGLQLGASSRDRTTSPTDAATRPAVRDQPRRAWEAPRRAAGEAWCARRARPAQRDVPDGMGVRPASALRHARRARRAAAPARLEARAQDRAAAAPAADAAPLQAREAKARRTGGPPRGRPPTLPPPGPRATDQDPGTEPAARRRQNRPTPGLEQPDKAQGAVAQDSVRRVGASLAQHPHEPAAAAPPGTPCRRRGARQRRRRWTPVL